MQYQLNYLMSAEEVRDFLVEHKSELKSLADVFGVVNCCWQFFFILNLV